MKNNSIEIRKITKMGKTSLGIGLPKKFLKDLGLNYEDIVEVEKTKNSLIIRKINTK